MDDGSALQPRRPTSRMRSQSGHGIWGFPISTPASAARQAIRSPYPETRSACGPRSGTQFRASVDLDGAEAVIIGGGPLGQAASSCSRYSMCPVIGPIPSAVTRVLGLFRSMPEASSGRNLETVTFHDLNSVQQDRSAVSLSHRSDPAPPGSLPITVIREGHSMSSAETPEISTALVEQLISEQFPQWRTCR